MSLMIKETCPDVGCGAWMVLREDEHGAFWHCRNCGQDCDDQGANERCRSCLNPRYKCDCGPFPNPYPRPEAPEQQDREA